MLFLKKENIMNLMKILYSIRQKLYRAMSLDIVNSFEIKPEVHGDTLIITTDALRQSTKVRETAFALHAEAQRMGLYGEGKG